LKSPNEKRVLKAKALGWHSFEVAREKLEFDPAAFEDGVVDRTDRKQLCALSNSSRRRSALHFKASVNRPRNMS
jgi:hypothetical protein